MEIEIWSFEITYNHTSDAVNTVQHICKHMQILGAVKGVVLAET
jgi:hypothetical protein